jgi:anti-anti-sigma regulatory factor
MELEHFSATFSDADSTLLVAGEVDELSTGTLRDAITTASGNYARPLLIELSDASLFSSDAVRTVVYAMQRGDITILAADGSIAQRVLQICGIPHRRA